MSKLKVGQIAILKTTEEPCLVMSVNAGQGDPKFNELSGTTVTVRRPVASEATGISHVINEFYIEELETKEEHQREAYDTIMRLRSGATSEASDPTEELSDLN